jgi:hypothetical protein
MCHIRLPGSVLGQELAQVMEQLPIFDPFDRLGPGA